MRLRFRPLAIFSSDLDDHSSVDELPSISPRIGQFFGLEGCIESMRLWAALLNLCQIYRTKLIPIRTCEKSPIILQRSLLFPERLPNKKQATKNPRFVLPQKSRVFFSPAGPPCRYASCPKSSCEASWVGLSSFLTTLESFLDLNFGGTWAYINSLEVQSTKQRIWGNYSHLSRGHPK